MTRSLFDLPFEEPPPEPAQPEPRAPDAPGLHRQRSSRPRIRGVLEEKWFEVWVEGEISNCKVWNTGPPLLHAQGRRRADQGRDVPVRPALPASSSPADGQHVIARGRVSVYEPKGEYQLVCEHLEPHGLGALQLAFEQLKQRLGAEGLFDAARKRPLPALPRKIGIVTSLDGAALRDIDQRARAGATPTRTSSSGRRACRARTRRRGRRTRRRAARPRRPAWTCHRRPRRRVDRGPLGVQRGGRRARDCGLPRAGRLGRGTRDRRDDRRLRRRRARRDAVERRGDGRRAQGRVRARASTASASGCARRPARASTRRRRVVHALATRPALAGLPARIGLRGRHVGELAHGLVQRARGAASRRASGACRRSGSGSRQCDQRRRLARLAGRLGGADATAARRAIARRPPRDRRFRHLAGRLEALSPLAVLGRGYAVCWNEDRTAIVRAPRARRWSDDDVHVTLADGRAATAR